MAIWTPLLCYDPLNMPPIAILLALSTIILWSFLAYLGALLSHIPPFLLVGIALCFCSLVGTVRVRSWWVNWKAYVVGIYGIFGYHFLYFSAFQNAPAVEVNLINYLWPLLIVLMTPLLLPGQKLRSYHIWGALIGLLGATLIITGGRLLPERGYPWGYFLAAGAALVWSSYSLLIKRLPPFPTSAVGGFSFVSGILALGFHFLTTYNSTVAITLSMRDWVFLALMGVGPMGLAFFTWNAAMRLGDPRVIGSLAYVTPLTSTFILVWLGGRSFSPTAAFAMILIVIGASLGSFDLFTGKWRRAEKIAAN